VLASTRYVLASHVVMLASREWVLGPIGIVLVSLRSSPLFRRSSPATVSQDRNSKFCLKMSSISSLGL